MNRAVRDQSLAILDVVRPAGLQAQIVQGGKHPHMKITDKAGGVHRIPLSLNFRGGGEAVGRQARRLLANLQKAGRA